MTKILQINNLNKSFNIYHLNRKIKAIDNITFSMDHGDFLGIVGKSGSGKSTIIKCIYRTYETDDGEILYDSANFGEVDIASLDERKMIHLRKNEIGYVSQFLSIMPRTTCLDLVITSLLEVGKPLEEAKEIAMDALRHFDLPEKLWDSYPNTFSGGEKLRLNIARAIVKNPRLLLLDEPTASLDKDSKIKVRESIEKLKNNGTSMIGIFHDLEFMEGLTNYIFRMDSKEIEVCQ